MRSGQVIRDSHIILMVLSAFRKKQIVHTFFYLSSELVARCKPSLGGPLFRKAASYGPIIGTETSGRVGTLRAVSFNIWGVSLICLLPACGTHLSGLGSASYDFDAKSGRNTRHNSLQILALLILLQL